MLNLVVDTLPICEAAFLISIVSMFDGFAFLIEGQGRFTGLTHG